LLILLFRELLVDLTSAFFLLRLSFTRWLSCAVLKAAEPLISKLLSAAPLWDFFRVNFVTFGRS
jgi:hypothetical protein